MPERSRITGLRRPGQGVSSSAVNNSMSRRRVEDETDWLDVESEEEDTDSEHGGQGYNPRGRQQYPLVTHARNEWKQEKYLNEKHRPPYYASSLKGYRPRSQARSVSPNCFDEMCDSGSLLECLEVMWSRLTVRVLVGWLVIFLVIYAMNRWFGAAAQKFAHDGAVRAAVRLKLTGSEPRGPRGRARTWFGSQHTDDFNGVVHMAGLRDENWEWADGKRMIVVGDVHGCSEPLRRLLQEVKFDREKDHLVFTGDLVAKGPDTAGVLDIANDLNASSVRGNHDDKLLLLHRDLDSPLTAMHTASGFPMTGTQVHRKESALAATLSLSQITYLQTCPLILTLGPLPGLAPSALVVHAGLVPGLALSSQDPSAIMNMRSIDVRTHTPLRNHAPLTQNRIKNELGDKYSEPPPPWNGKKSKARVFDLDEKYVLPWTRLWEEWQATVKEEDRVLVAYGHDSPVGLVDGKWAVGLDTGCVKGGKLTALVLEMKGGTVGRRLQSVRCKEGRM